MSSLHFVGGEKGGVGKSVVARLLCQSFIDQQREFAAFDGDASHPALLRYYAGYATAVDLTRFESCDAMLLAALSGTPVVADLPAQSARPLARWLDDSGVADLAEESGVRIVHWHVMDDGKDSLRQLAPVLERRAPAVDFVVVRNLGRGADFAWMDSSPEMERARQSGASFVDLPALHGPTMSKIDRLDASFWAACNLSEGECLNPLERQRVRTWLLRSQAALRAAHPALREAAQQNQSQSANTDASSDSALN